MFGRRYFKQHNTPNHYFIKGNAYYREGMFAVAITYYTLCVKLDPNHLDAYINRGNCYIEEKGYIGAIEDFQYVLKKNPKYALAYAYLARAYYEKGNNNEAITAARNAIFYNSKSTLAHIILGLVHYATQNYNSAILALTQAMQHDSNCSFSCKHRGYVYCTIGLFDEALADYSEAIERNPKEKIEDKKLISCLEQCEDLSGISSDTIIQLIYGISQINEAKKIALLNKCLVEGNPLGNHIWSVEFPGDNCGHRSGMIKDICDYLARSEGGLVMPASLVSVTHCTLFNASFRQVDPARYLKKENFATNLEEENDGIYFRHL